LQSVVAAVVAGALLSQWEYVAGDAGA